MDFGIYDQYRIPPEGKNAGPSRKYPSSNLRTEYPALRHAGIM